MIIVDENAVNKRLDVFLHENIDISRSQIKNLIDEGKITLNGKQVKAGTKLSLNDKILCEIPKPQEVSTTPENIPIEIVYEDKDLAVINKPQGLVVHAGAGNHSGTLVNALLYHLKDLSGINGKLRPGIVHRLDKNTSGLLLIAKNDFAHISLANQIAEKSCKRSYIALLDGVLKQESGIIETHIARDKKNRLLMNICSENEGKLAITHYSVIKYYEGFTLVEFSLQTGRTHQIRVHASRVLHHAIVGDKEYNPSTKVNGQLLHAYKIEFAQPRTEQRIVLEIPLPSHFQNYLMKLKKKC